MKKIYENIIIGNGLTGLTIAKLLSLKSKDYLIIDKNNTVGGKVSTKTFSDYKLDEGFQVVLEDYPNLKIFPEINKSSFRKFKSGFVTKKKNNLYQILNPFKSFKGLLPGNTFPGFTLKDKFLLLKLVLLSNRYENANVPVKKFLKNFGFSNTFINEFFVSFFQGVFLSKNLDVPLKYFLFIFKLFSKSSVSIPVGGINMIPQSILLQLDSTKYKLNKEVACIESNSLTTKDGECFYFNKLYCTDPKIEELMQIELNRNLFAEITYNGTQCFYFLASITDVDDSFIYLSPESENITNVSLKRLSTDKYIVSVSSLSMEISKDSIEKEILSYFTNIKSISFLSKFKINNALPSNSKFFDFNGKSFCQYTKNIYFAGDFLSSPCLNGAIQSAINLVESLDS
ncbi:MAG: FAD-dependent oxidoreductase [Thermodesulfobacteriota bacterium]|nr:MAG: hypothetical protein EVA31_00595 [Candidatus Dadabacteria bacterium]